jgi:hypothetical protein
MSAMLFIQLLALILIATVAFAIALAFVFHNLLKQTRKMQIEMMNDMMSADEEAPDLDEAFRTIPMDTNPFTNH